MTGTTELRKLDIEKYLKGERKFNPWNIKRYCNYVFETLNSTYRIDEEEKIWGKLYVEGREIEMIGGLKHGKYLEICNDMDLEKWPDYHKEMTRKEAMWIIRTHGEHVKEGLRLAVLVKPEEKPEEWPESVLYIPKTTWLFTTMIKKMYPVPDIN